MSASFNKVYFGLATATVCIPCFAAYYLYNTGYTWMALVLNITTLALMTVFISVFLGYKIIRFGAPYVFALLSRANRILTPIALGISRTRVVGPLLSLVIRFNFFMCFMLLLLCDRVVRRVLGRCVGKHISQHLVSVCNAIDPDFQMFDEKVQSLSCFEDIGDEITQSTYSIPSSPMPCYSQSLAYTLAVASKLVYEDIGLIRYELAASGFDVENTFMPIAYKNICAFIVEKQDDILLVFRGTNPLNIQNFVTNLTVGKKPVCSSTLDMGYVHQGFWDAMGDPTAHTSTPASDTTLHIELSGASVYRTLISAVQAVHKVVSFLTLNMWQHVADPIDSGWMGHDTDIRSQAMYAQAENWIIELCNRPSSTATETHSLPMGLGGHQNFSLGQKRLYITGHSLGGALATIFLAKMVQSDSPLLPHFAGLYTYGQPRVGDETFSRIFHSNLSRKIFHHVYNNDIVPRVPGWDGYSTPPGTLVFITADYTITLYPPNANNEPVCVRPISFLHLSGLLNKHVIRRLGKESVLKILFRVIFPFFINDHFPSGYCGGLRKGTIHWTHGDEELLTFTKG